MSIHHRWIGSTPLPVELPREGYRKLTGRGLATVHVLGGAHLSAASAEQAARFIQQVLKRIIRTITRCCRKERPAFPCRSFATSVIIRSDGRGSQPRRHRITLRMGARDSSFPSFLHPHLRLRRCAPRRCCSSSATAAPTCWTRSSTGRATRCRPSSTLW